MAARPTTRRASHEPSAPRSDAPGHPQVRDFATPSTAYAIEWDVRSVYDFLFSLTDDAGSTDDLPEPDRTWLTESRASLPAETRRDLDEAFAHSMGILVAAFAVERADLRSVEAFVEAVDAAPTEEFIRIVLGDLERDRDLGDLVKRAAAGDQTALDALIEAVPDHKAGFQVLLRDPAAAHRTIIRVLRAWTPIFMTIEPRIAGILERDFALRGADRGAYRGTELIERTTGGIRWLPEMGIRRVILAPSYFSRPYNFLLAGDDWRFFGYPVADDALEPEDRLVPPPAIVRLHRALGDETRLRILKLLAGHDLYLTEIAQQLELSKPTIKHHLAQLRAAGLVTVIEAGAVIYYSLRRERIDTASTELGRFLVP